MPFFGFKKLRNVGDADFHFESRRYPVECFHSLAGEFLAVLMQIDRVANGINPKHEIRILGLFGV